MQISLTAQRFTNIIILDLFGCFKITDLSMPYIGQLPHLQVLYLSWCDRITDNGLKHLTKLSKLTELYISNCSKITDKGIIESVIQLTSLKILGMNNTNVSDEGKRFTGIQKT